MYKLITRLREFYHFTGRNARGNYCWVLSGGGWNIRMQKKLDIREIVGTLPAAVSYMCFLPGLQPSMGVSCRMKANT